MIDPKTLEYASTHEWVHRDGDIATIGISRFAVDQLTDLIMIDLPTVGSKIISGKGFGEIESVKAVSDLYAPIDGEVIEVNPLVKADVQILADDPYNKGWLIKVKMIGTSNPISLLDFASYEHQLADQSH